MTVQVCAAPTTTVTVGGQTYNVTYTDPAISYNSNPALFTTANMPWWGDSSTAQQVAIAVGATFGSNINFGQFGPIFAYDFTGLVAGYMIESASATLTLAALGATQPQTYATATVAPSPTPGPGSSVLQPPPRT